MPDITSSMKEDKKGPKNREITLGLGYSKNTVSKNTNIITKQFTLKEFIWGCVKSFFEVQYECVLSLLDPDYLES